MTHLEVYLINIISNITGKKTKKKKRERDGLLYSLPCNVSSEMLISYSSFGKCGGLSLMSIMLISTPNLVSIERSFFLASSVSYRLKYMIQS